METSNCRDSRKRALATALAAIGVVAVSWASFSTDALAENRNHRKYAHHGQIARHERQVVVPRAMYSRDRAIYARYESGRVYYAPHRHYHVQYTFPVYVNGAVRYRPYSYCGDHVFLTGAVTLPRLAIGIQVGPAWGYYYRDQGYDVYDDAAGCYGNDCDYDDGYRYRYDHSRYRHDRDDEDDSDDECDD